MPVLPVEQIGTTGQTKRMKFAFLLFVSFLLASSLSTADETTSDSDHITTELLAELKQIGYGDLLPDDPIVKGFRKLITAIEECKGDIRGSNICINNMQKNLHKSIEGKSGGSPPMEIGEAIVDEIINAIFRGDLIYAADNPKKHNGNMFSKINGVYGSVGAIVGVFGNVLGIYDVFGRKSNQELMDGLKEIERQLDEINNTIEQLMSAVDESSIQTQYISAQRVIMESIRCFNNYANMTEPENKAYWLREFNKYGSLVRESTSFIMDGMLGNGFIATDIIKTLERLADGNAAVFEEHTGNFYALINSGLYIHSTFWQYDNVTSERANGPVRDLFEVTYEKIGLRVNQTIDGMRSGKTADIVIHSEMIIDDGQDISAAAVKTRPKRQWMMALEVVGFVFNMFNSAANGIGLYNRLTTPTTDDLYNEIVNIQNELTEIQDSLNDVINQVKVSSIQSQYVSSQRVIFESYRIVTYYLNMTETTDMVTTPEDVEFWQLEFAKWGSMLRESINFFLDGLMGGGFIGSDVLETMAEISGGSPDKVKYLTDNFLGIVNTGFYVHALYTRFSNISEEANKPVLDLFDSTYNHVGERINMTVGMVEERSEVESIMRTAMAKGGSSMTTYRDNVYAALKDRYSQRDWFVAVYNHNYNDDIGEGPDDEHYFDPAFYYVSYDGKDASAMSFPTNNNKDKAALDSQTISAVNSYDCTDKRQESAKNMVSSMRDQIKYVCPDCNVGAIQKRYCNPCYYMKEKWHDCSWEYTFGQLIEGKVKSCNTLAADAVFNAAHFPYDVYVLPPTRPYTVPESE